MAEVQDVIYKTFEGTTSVYMDDSGYVVSTEGGLTATDGNVLVATSTYYIPYGVAAMSTENPRYFGDPATEDQYLTAPPIAIWQSGIRDVQVIEHASRTTAIVIGDMVGVIDTGQIAHIADCPSYTQLASASITDAQLLIFVRSIVGIAEEAIAAGSDPSDGDNKILVRLKIGG